MHHFYRLPIRLTKAQYDPHEHRDRAPTFVGGAEPMTDPFGQATYQEVWRVPCPPFSLLHCLLPPVIVVVVEHLIFVALSTLFRWVFFPSMIMPIR
jgi:hypothetical protein